MTSLGRLALLFVGTVLVSASFAGPETGSFAPAEAAADEIRAAAGSDAAILPAGLLRQEFKSGDLSKLIQFPKDEIAVLKLTGKQILEALERSVALYPSANQGFLQLSGISATFSKSAPSGRRVSDATIVGSRIEASRTYTVAMPGSLARGGLGYYLLWEKKDIDRTLTGQTLESVLKGKTSSNPAPRWKSVD